jgi:hypothetical protein
MPIHYRSIGPVSEEFVQAVREALDYDPETGNLTWKYDRSNVKAGSIAGHLHKGTGYWYVRFRNRLYRTHRLIWLLMVGRWPHEQIDHRDGNRGNNAWLNLRECSNTQNVHNTPHDKRNSSGFRGVSWCRRTKRWRAQLWHNGASVNLGRFATREEAHEARQRKVKELFGEFAPIR